METYDLLDYEEDEYDRAIEECERWIYENEAWESDATREYLEKEYFKEEKDLLRELTSIIVKFIIKNYKKMGEEAKKELKCNYPGEYMIAEEIIKVMEEK